MSDSMQNQYYHIHVNHGWSYTYVYVFVVVFALRDFGGNQLNWFTAQHTPDLLRKWLQTVCETAFSMGTMSYENKW